MRTAANHMKRSHRSQKGHYMAGLSRYKDRVMIDQHKNSSLQALMAKTFRRNRENRAAKQAEA